MCPRHIRNRERGNKKLVKKINAGITVNPGGLSTQKLSWSKIALNRWMKTYSLWNRNAPSLSSPDWAEIRLPRSFVIIIRSTSKSRPNNIRGGKNVRPYVRPSVRPSTKSFFHFNEIWYIGRGRWVMHDGMPYDRIQGQGQGHEPFKVRIPSIFKTYLLRHLQ